MKKVIFADQLRGLAFLCVVAVHWLGIFRDYNLISYITGAPAIDTSNHNLYDNLLPGLPNFNYGPFGVSIFFMISGFVIPFSMMNGSKKKFIISRLLRIYPVYISSSFIMLAFYYASHRYWGSSGQYSLNEIISNISLTSSMLNYQSIDYVNWTLEIEIKFYLICFLFFNFIKSSKIGVIIIPSLFLVFSSITRNFHIFDASYMYGISFHNLRIEMVYVSYMFLGVLVNRLYTNKINIIEFSIGSVFLLYVVYQTSVIVGINNIQLTYNYLYGYIVFLSCYMIRNSFESNVVLSFLSRVSYPFYALHSVIGYCTMRYLTSLNISHASSFIIAFAIVLLIAMLVNKIIEQPSLMLAKKIFSNR